MLSVRPKVAELVFQLYGRTLHPELFEVFGTQTIQRGDYRARVSITSAGHVVSWQYKGLVLTEVAQTLRRAVRMGDLVARCGGEEFVIVLSHSDRERGLQFGARVRQAIESTTVTCDGGLTLVVTASIGVADSESCGLDIEGLLARADAAMYEAKQSGRNRVVAAAEA